MGMYWKASHCVYDCRYHVVWITKYRRKVLNERVSSYLRKVLEGICKELHIRVLKIGIEEDHVHMYITVPPVQPISYVLKILKGRSSKVMRKKFKDYFSEFYLKEVLWAVGYFVATVGEVTHKVVAKYVEDQGKKDIEEECIELKDSGLC